MAIAQFTRYAGTSNKGKTMYLFTGSRPDITPAQMIAGIPLVANFLATYGVWSPNPEQQGSLSDLLVWGFALLGADAAIRIGRNVRDGLKK